MKRETSDPEREQPSRLEVIGAVISLGVLGFWFGIEAALYVQLLYILHFSPLLIFFKNMLLSALDSICYPHFYVTLYYNGSPIFVIAEWATLLVDIRCPRGGS